MANVKLVQHIVDTFKSGTETLKKHAHVYDMEKKAYVPMPAPSGPMTAQPPMDPAAMQGGAPMPPMDPAAAQGGAPMPPGAPMDPNAMAAGGAPMPPGAPMDPNAAMGAGAPPMDPAAAQGGGMPPEMETALSDLASGVETTAQTAEQTKSQVDQLAERQLATEQELNELREKLKTPAPMEGQEAGSEAAAPSKEDPMSAGLQQLA